MLLLAAVLMFAPGPAPGPLDIAILERQILAFTNAERGRYGLRALAGDDILHAIARGHSQDMLRRNFFSHTNPEGEGPGERVMRQDRRHFVEVAENIWMGSGYPPARIERIAGEIVSAWMNSRGHRENILRREVHLIGIGLVVSGGRVYATQVFAGMRGR
jgi:uncharacterized protein YkwD